MQEAPDRQISLTDPDARSMNARGGGLVGYNVQTAVDAKHHLIVAHEVTNVGSDRHQLSKMAGQARAAMGTDTLEAVADRGYYEVDELYACEQAGITAYVPRPLTSVNVAQGLFGKRDFIYQPEDDEYVCPAGERLIYRFTRIEAGKTVHRYWSSACPRCPIRSKCTPSLYRRVSRYEHEPTLDAVLARVDREPERMRIRRQTVEHIFGTLKSWMGATHFQLKTRPRVSTEMSLHVLAYNMKRVMRILGTGPLMAAIRA